MAIDTAAKRSSALDFEEVWQPASPLPDGAVEQGDRQHMVWSYSGIAATGAVVVTTSRPQWVAGGVHLGGFQTGEVHRLDFRAGMRAGVGFVGGPS